MQDQTVLSHSNTREVPPSLFILSSTSVPPSWNNSINPSSCTASCSAKAFSEPAFTFLAGPRSGRFVCRWTTICGWAQFYRHTRWTLNTLFSRRWRWAPIVTLVAATHDWYFGLFHARASVAIRGVIGHLLVLHTTITIQANRVVMLWWCRGLNSIHRTIVATRIGGIS